MECPVCYENSKKFVKCIKCENEVCIICAKKYILSSIREPHCMQCETGWTYKFLSKNFPNNWLYSTKQKSDKSSLMTLRDHFKKISLDREKSKIPETMEEITRQRRLEIERAKQEFRKRLETLPIIRKLDELRLEISLIDTDLHELENLRGLDKYDDLDEEMKKRYLELSERDKEMTDRLSSLRIKQEKLNTEYRTILGDKKEEPKLEKITYVFGCFDEDCRGLVESKSHRCQLCETKYCRKCRSTKEKKHKCKEEEIESVNMIKDETKPCPKCGVAIYKISGCDQMFCTNCKTTFSWTTLRIETGMVHNPHYFEWMRGQGLTGDQVIRNDVGCGVGIIEDQRLAHIYYSIQYIRDQVRGDGVLVDKYLRKLDESRKDYILSKIDEKKWNNSIFLKERKIQNLRKMMEIRETACVIATDIFQRNLSDKSKRNPSELCLKELEEVRQWINTLIIEEMFAIGFKKPKLLNSQWGIQNYDKVMNIPAKKDKGKNPIDKGKKPMVTEKVADKGKKPMVNEREVDEGSSSSQTITIDDSDEDIPLESLLVKEEVFFDDSDDYLYMLDSDEWSD